MINMKSGQDYLSRKKYNLTQSCLPPSPCPPPCPPCPPPPCVPCVPCPPRPCPPPPPPTTVFYPTTPLVPPGVNFNFNYAPNSVNQANPLCPPGYLGCPPGPCPPGPCPPGPCPPGPCPPEPCNIPGVTGQVLLSDGACGITVSNFLYDSCFNNLISGAGERNSTTNDIALGEGSGYSQAANNIAIGTNAGKFQTAENVIAIGVSAGYVQSAPGAIAIGAGAASQYQSAASIMLNAGNPQGATNDQGLAGFFVDPVRGTTTVLSHMMYNDVTKEIYYADGVEFVQNPAVAAFNLNNNDVINAGNILPPAGNTTVSLGSDTNRWAEVWVGPASVHIGTPSQDFKLSVDGDDLIVATTEKTYSLLLNPGPQGLTGVPSFTQGISTTIVNTNIIDGGSQGLTITGDVFFANNVTIGGLCTVTTLSGFTAQFERGTFTLGLDVGGNANFTSDVNITGILTGVTAVFSTANITTDLSVGGMLIVDYGIMAASIHAQSLLDVSGSLTVDGVAAVNDLEVNNSMSYKGTPFAPAACVVEDSLDISGVSAHINLNVMSNIVSLLNFTTESIGGQTFSVDFWIDANGSASGAPSKSYVLQNVGNQTYFLHTSFAGVATGNWYVTAKINDATLSDSELTLLSNFI